MVIKVRINPSYEWQEDARNKGISHREIEVLELIAQGFDNKQIAEIIKIQYQSVKNHTYQLNNKLGAENSTQALLIAVGKRIIEVENTEIRKPEPGISEKVAKFLNIVLKTEDTELTKKIKKWMIRNGIDVDI